MSKQMTPGQDVSKSATGGGRGGDKRDAANTSTSTSTNEGEGSRSADRSYRQHVEDFEKRNDTADLGRKAMREVEADDSSYRQAEKEGKSRAAEEDPEVRR